MNKYIGAKLIEAEEASFEEANLLKIGACKTIKEAREKFKGAAVGIEKGKPGYAVRYPDGYISWSPKEIFEKAYMQVETNLGVQSGVSVSEHMVKEFISHTETSTIGDKTTMVRCVLRNGFELIETTSCVDAQNYNEKLGEEICMEKIESKVWYLLGFLLQTAWHGIK